jgi:hypothetical protein
MKQHSEQHENHISQCDAMGQMAGDACDVTLFSNEDEEDKDDPLAPSEHCEKVELLVAPDPCFIDCLPIDTELNFLVLSSAAVGELFPLFCRDSGEAVKNDDTCGAALPPQLLEEFQARMERDGALEHARRLTCKEEPLGSDKHRGLHKFDNSLRTAMDTPRWEGSHDMVEMGPADDECVKSLLLVPRRGNFDVHCQPSPVGLMSANTSPNTEIETSLIWGMSHRTLVGDTHGPQS